MEILFFYLLLLLNFVKSIEFKKNSDILNTPKSADPKVKEILEIQDILNHISQSKHFIIVFHADWCYHCKQFLPSFYEASKYQLSNQLEFLSVDCKNRNVCDHFKVKGYPTIQMYYGGVLQQYEVPRQLESLLEYIDKLFSPDIIDLQQDQINHFSNFYGEVSFLIISEPQHPQFISCLHDIAKDNKPYIYFGHLNASSFTTKSGINLSSPAIMTLGVNENFMFTLQADSITYCDKIKEFIDLNKFPLTKRLTRSYLRRLQSQSHYIIISLIDQQSNEDTRFLFNTYQTVALENRENRFTYLDINEDKEMMTNLNLQDNHYPKVLIYNTEKKRFYIDEYVYREETKNMLKLKDLINNLNSGKIEFSSGFWLEDILEKYGIKINRFTLTIVCVILFFVVLLIFLVSESNKKHEGKVQKADEEEEKNKEKKNN